MIDQDWRRRFSVLSERLEGQAPASECRLALHAFKEIKNPTPKEDFQYNRDNYSPNNSGFNADELIEKSVDKALDLGIWAAILFKK